jgi:hypothetical protein
VAMLDTRAPQQWHAGGKINLSPCATSNQSSSEHRPAQSATVQQAL